MSKNEFLKKLDKALAEVPENDRKEILYDYEEHFRNASAAGKTEVETINALGDPQSIAKQYLTGDSGKAIATPQPFLKVFCSIWIKVRPGLVNFSERITGSSLTFILLMALLLGVLVLEIIVLENQNQVLNNQKKYQQQSLVSAIKVYQRQAKFNQDVFFAGLLKVAARAQHNKDTIKTAAYIIANVGFNVPPVLEIAQVAGNADHEVKRLKDLLVLTITYGGDNLRIVELAKQAVNNEISEAELESAIKYYRAHSRVKTIEEAEKNMEQAFENL